MYEQKIKIPSIAGELLPCAYKTNVQRCIELPVLGLLERPGDVSEGQVPGLRERLDVVSDQRLDVDRKPEVEVTVAILKDFLAGSLSARFNAEPAVVAECSISEGRVRAKR